MSGTLGPISIWRQSDFRFFAQPMRDTQTVLLCNNVSHWLGASLESALILHANADSIVIIILVIAVLEFREHTPHVFCTGKLGMGCLLYFFFAGGGSRGLRCEDLKELIWPYRWLSALATELLQSCTKPSICWLPMDYLLNSLVIETTTTTTRLWYVSICAKIREKHHMPWRAWSIPVLVQFFHCSEAMW